MLDTNSPLAQAIADLFNITHLIGLGIFALVTGLVLYCIARFRAKPGAPEPLAVHGNMRLELTWTFGAVAILALLLVLTINTMGKAEPISAGLESTADAINLVGQPVPAGAPEAKDAGARPKADVVIIGHQWWWEIQYPGTKAVTANEVHIPTGKVLTLQIESADVIHDLWVPQLGRKKDLNPGYVNYMAWQANNPGTYEGACAEYCGTQHAWMRIRVIAQKPDDYNAWLSAQSQPAVAATTPNLQHGQALFKQKTCVSCHVISGVSAASAVGPNLTHLGSRSIIGAGVVDNTTDQLTKWIQNPQTIKPGVNMPAVPLAPDELTDLVAYLESLK